MRVQLTRQPDDHQRDERGAIAVMVGILAVVMVGILAFVADFGVVYASQRKLQNASDAAVLAAGRRIIAESSPGQTCAQMIANPSVTQADARAAFTENADGSATLLGNAVTITCTDAVMPGRVVVSANASQTSPAIFGGIYDQDDYQLAKSAKSVVGPAGRLMGVRPFAVCDALGNIGNSAPNAYLNLDFDNADLGCGTASGNFGTLDIRYPPVHGSPGTSTVEGWIEDGYDGSLPATSPLSLAGSPGIPSSNFADEFAAILDTPIVLPTFDVRSGSGSNSVYNITGFIEVEVCGFKLTSSSGSLTTGTCFQSSTAPSANNARFLQLRFVRFIAIGDLDLTCSIAATCDGGPKLVKLAQ